MKLLSNVLSHYEAQSTIRALNLSYVNVSAARPEDIRRLCRLLRSSPHLSTVDFSHAVFPEEIGPIVDIFEAMKRLDSLKIYRVEGCALGGNLALFSVVASAFSESQAEKIFLSENKLGASQTNIGPPLRRILSSTTLKTVDLSMNPLGSAPPKVFAEILKGVKEMKGASLELAYTELSKRTFEEVFCLIENISVNPHVRALGLSGNDFSEWDGGHVGKILLLLSGKSHIAVLDLNGIVLSIVPRGDMALFLSQMRDRNVLTSLDITDSDMSYYERARMTEVVDCFVDLIRNGRHLKEFTYEGDAASIELNDRIVAAVTRNTQLCFVQIAGIHLLSDHREGLARAMASRPPVEDRAGAETQKSQRWNFFQASQRLLVRGSCGESASPQPPKYG